jgi:hypothetical protein
MAYFANGSEADYYEEKYCERCVHYPGDSHEICPVMELHQMWNYDAAGKDADKTKATALNTLWPLEKGGYPNADCAMFHEAVKERGEA